MRHIAIILLLSASAAFAAEPSYRDIMSRFERAEAAIEAGDVVPSRDLAPLIAFLRSVKDEAISAASSASSATSANPTATVPSPSKNI